MRPIKKNSLQIKTAKRKRVLFLTKKHPTLNIFRLNSNRLFVSLTIKRGRLLSFLLPVDNPSVK